MIHSKLVSGRACRSLERLIVLIGGIKGRQRNGGLSITLADTDFLGIRGGLTALHVFVAAFTSGFPTLGGSLTEHTRQASVCFRGYNQT